MSGTRIGAIGGSIFFEPIGQTNEAVLDCTGHGKSVYMNITREHGTALRDALSAWLNIDAPASHVSHSAVQATGAEVAQQAASAPQAGMCSCGHDVGEHRSLYRDKGACSGTDWDISESAEFDCDCKAFTAVPADPTPQIRHERYMQLTARTTFGLCAILRNRGHVGPLNTWSRHDLVAAILRAEGYGLEQNSLPAVQS